MGGVPWHLWEWFEEEGPPPRLLESGRFSETAWLAFWSHALLPEPGAPTRGHRLRLSLDNGPLLFEGWEQIPGVERMRAWAASDPGVLRPLVDLQFDRHGEAPEAVALDDRRRLVTA